jgi:hypothetical protein
MSVKMGRRKLRQSSVASSLLVDSIQIREFEAPLGRSLSDGWRGSRMTRHGKPRKMKSMNMIKVSKESYKRRKKVECRSMSVKMGRRKLRQSSVASSLLVDSIRIREFEAPLGRSLSDGWRGNRMTRHGKPTSSSRLVTTSWTVLALFTSAGSASA